MARMTHVKKAAAAVLLMAALLLGLSGLDGAGRTTSQTTATETTATETTATETTATQTTTTQTTTTQTTVAAAPAPTRAPSPTSLLEAHGPQGTVRLTVRLAPSASAADLDAAIAASGGSRQHTLDQIRSVTVNVPATQADALLASLERDAAVQRVEPSVRVGIAGDPDAEGAQGHEDQWALSRIGWDVARAGTSITGGATIAVLDTGIDASHPELAGRVVEGVSFTGGDPNTDPHGHGTALAGIAVANADDDAGISGVAFAGVNVASVQVLHADGTGDDVDVVAGVLWAVEHGAQVIMMGFSTDDYSPALAEAIEYAWTQGVVVVAATGNGGQDVVTYPSGMPHVLGVAATNGDDQVTGSSNTGSADLAAPGTSILTIAPGAGLTAVRGTSAAVAHVAGVAALLSASGHDNAYIFDQVRWATVPIEGHDFGRTDLTLALGPALTGPAAAEHEMPAPGEEFPIYSASGLVTNVTASATTLAEGQTATWTFNFTPESNMTRTHRVHLTFPAGFDVTGIPGGGPTAAPGYTAATFGAEFLAGTYPYRLVTDGPNRVVEIYAYHPSVSGTLLAGGTPSSISIAGVVNGPLGYALTDIEFRTTADFLVPANPTTLTDESGPAADPPVLQTATTNADGTQVILDFDKDMADPTGKHGQFAVSGRTITGAALDGGDASIIILTLDGNPPIYNDVSATVSYTAGDVLADDGGILATFAGQGIDESNSTVFAPPVLQTATTNAAGTQVILTFDKDMADPTGKHGQFAVSGRTITGAALDGGDASIIILTLDGTPPIYNDVAATVSYTPGDVVAADTGVLAAFAGQAIDESNSTVFDPPVFVSATTSTDGTTITITFDKAMTDAAGRQGDFSFNDGGARTFSSVVSTVGMTITLAVQGAPITDAAVLTVSYSGAPAVTATNTGILANFAGQAVTNDVDPAPPVLQSATTNAAGNQVILDFDKDMADPTGKHGQFAVSGRTITGAALDGGDNSRIILTLDGNPPIYNDQAATVSYTPGDVLAADDGVLAQFTGTGIDESASTVFVPPVVTNATTNTAGTIISLTFDKNMADPDGLHGNFSFNDGGARALSAAELDGGNAAIIHLTVDGAAIESGDTVTVSYSGSPAVTAADTGILANFAGTGVTNTVNAVPPVLQSVTTNAAGNQVILDFDKNMANPATKHDQFTLSGGRTPTGASLDGGDNSRIILTFSGPPIYNDQGATVSYSPGDVLAADNGVLGAFTGTGIDESNSTVFVPPVLVSAVTNSAGTQIILTFDKNMTDAAGKEGEFAFNDGGARSFSGVASTSGMTITLTVQGAPVTDAAVVTVSYTAGTVTSTDTGILANFGPSAVTNVVDPAAPNLLSATTNAAGTQVILDFDKNMANPNGKQAQFTLSGGRSASAAALDGGDASIIILTVSGPPIYNDQAATVSYTPGDVVAADAGVLGPFASIGIDESNSTVFVPPVLQSATTNAAGTQLRLDFDKNMASPVGKHGQFTLSGGRTASAAVLDGGDSSIIVLTVSPPIYNDVAATVSYTPGDVLAADTGVLAQFTGTGIDEGNSTVFAPPVFVSAATSTDGTKITITFDRAMADPAAEFGNFTFSDGTGRTFTAAALDGDPTKIVLTVDGDPIGNGDTITVSYTSGGVVATNTGILAAFTAQAVTNAVPGGGGGGFFPPPAPTPKPPMVEDGLPTPIPGFEPEIFDLNTGSTLPTKVSALVVNVTRTGPEQRQTEVFLSVPQGAVANGWKVLIQSVTSIADLEEVAPLPTLQGRILSAVSAQVLDQTNKPITMKFDKPIAVTAVLPPEALPLNAVLSAFTMAYWDGTDWIDVPSEARLLPDGSVEVTTQAEHFTLYSVKYRRLRGFVAPAKFGSGTIDLVMLEAGASFEELSLATKRESAGAVWALDSKGKFHIFIPDGPVFINQAFRAAFPNAFPDFKPMLLVKESDNVGSPGE